jgi:[ribosomal protein S5]-alanine N-acetyltransferase
VNIILKTPRLILREFTEADASLVLQLNSLPEVLKYVHEPRLETEEEARQILVNIILPQYRNKLGRWATFTKENNEFVGWCGLKYVAESDEIDLGYRFLPAAWGKGYATESADHTLEYGLHKLKLKSITARAHIENLASLKVLEKIGMSWVNDEIFDGCPVRTFISERQAK